MEKLMARALTDYGVAYVEQKQIGPYWADFWIPGRNAVVEVDGLFWHKSRKDKDDRKDKYLRACGYQVFRFTEAAVTENAAMCVRTIMRDDIVAEQFKVWRDD